MAGEVPRAAGAKWEYALIVSDPTTDLQDEVLGTKVQVRLVAEWPCKEDIWDASPRLINTNYTIHGRKNGSHIELFYMDGHENGFYEAEMKHLEAQFIKSGYKVTKYFSPEDKTSIRQKTIQDALLDGVAHGITQPYDQAILLGSADRKNLLLVPVDQITCKQVLMAFYDNPHQMTAGQDYVMGVVLTDNVDFFVDVEEEEWDGYFAKGDRHVDVLFRKFNADRTTPAPAGSTRQEVSAETPGGRGGGGCGDTLTIPEDALGSSGQRRAITADTRRAKRKAEVVTRVEEQKKNRKIQDSENDNSDDSSDESDESDEIGHWITLPSRTRMAHKAVKLAVVMVACEVLRTGPSEGFSTDELAKFRGMNNDEFMEKLREKSRVGRLKGKSKAGQPKGKKNKAVTDPLPSGPKGAITDA